MPAYFLEHHQILELLIAKTLPNYVKADGNVETLAIFSTAFGEI